MYKSRINRKVSCAECGHGKPRSKWKEFILNCLAMFEKQTVLWDTNIKRYFLNNLGEIPQQDKLRTQPWGDVQNREQKPPGAFKGKTKVPVWRISVSFCRTAGSDRIALSETNKTEVLGTKNTRDDRKRMKNEQLLLRPWMLYLNPQLL